MYFGSGDAVPADLQSRAVAERRTRAEANRPPRTIGSAKRFRLAYEPSLKCAASLWMTSSSRQEWTTAKPSCSTRWTKFRTPIALVLHSVQSLPPSTYLHFQQLTRSAQETLLGTRCEHLGKDRSESRVNRFALQREHTEHAFVNATKRFLLDKSVKCLDP
jgi:hypothetical protein